MINYVLTLIHLLLWIFIYYKKFKTYFNPISLFCSALFISVISVYFSDILGLLRGANISDSFVVLNIYNISAITFLLPWFGFRDTVYLVKTNFRKENSILKLSIIFLFLFFLLTFLSYFFLGGIPILEMLSGSLNIVEYNELVKRLPLGMLSLLLLTSTILSILFSSFFINRKTLNYSSRYLFILFIITIISTVWQGKRQGILMLFFFVIARYFQNTPSFDNKTKSTFSKFYFFIYFVVFIILFSQIGRIRHNESSSDNSEILSYTMYPVMNFSYTVSESNFWGSTILPISVINDLFPRRVSDKKEYVQKEITAFEPTSPSGYLNPWFKDYGIFGIFVGSILLSITSKYYYKRRFLSENFMRKNIYLLWCCITVGVYSHFITLNYFVVPFILIIILDLFSEKQRI